MAEVSLRDKVAIIGVGCTKFGELFEMSPADLLVEAAYEAYEDAGVEPKEIQAGWLGTCGPTIEGVAGSSFVDCLGLKDIPVSRQSNYCATGIDAFRNASFAIALGIYDLALVIGMEKMRDVAPRDSLVKAITEGGHPLIVKGMTAPGCYAFSATKYLKTYGVDREVLARVAVKNHHHGSLNPKAHFQKEITISQALAAYKISEPLGLYDCCPVTDGAAAAIITRPDIAKRYRSDYVLVKGMGLSVRSDTQLYDPEFDFLGFPATQIAAQQAYQQAGIKDPRKEIGFAEVHDCFTITEIINYEDLGFCPRGEGHRFISEGVSTLKGELPVNPSGGLKCFGHPIGATGVRQIYELTTQLQGRAVRPERQVKNPKLGLAHNLGGPGSVACVTILGRQ